MDLKTLREQAISEANNEFAEEKVYKFKRNIKSIISKISVNNLTIIEKQKENEKLKKELAEYELEEFNRVSL